MSNEKFAIEVGPGDVPHDTGVVNQGEETPIERGRRVEAAIRDILGDGATDVQLALMARIAELEDKYEKVMLRCQVVADAALQAEAKANDSLDQMNQVRSVLGGHLENDHAELVKAVERIEQRFEYDLKTDTFACKGCGALGPHIEKTDELLVEYRKWWTDKAEEIYTRINEHERLLSIVGTGRRDENTAQALIDRVRELVQPR